MVKPNPAAYLDPARPLCWRLPFLRLHAHPGASQFCLEPSTCSLRLSAVVGSVPRLLLRATPKPRNAPTKIG